MPSNPSAKQPAKKQRVVYINDPVRNAQLKYSSNLIRTTKYTLITFLPKNLFEQFRRMSNFYFLLVMIINCLPDMSVVVPITSILPVFFILGVSGIKEGWEDWCRHKMDVATNNMPVDVFRGGKLITVRSAELLAGDVVKVYWSADFLSLFAWRRDALCSNDEIPADVVLLASSDDGTCYVQTANLDGSERRALNQRGRLHPLGSFFTLAHAGKRR